jgi:hypothetical protein
MNKIFLCLILFAPVKLLSQNIAFADLVVAYGAKGDGSTDDYKALQKAIDTAISYGQTELFLRSGTYNISQGLLFTNRSGKFLNGIHFYGSHSTIHVTNPRTFAIGLWKVKGFRCENIVTTGMNTGLNNYSPYQIMCDTATTFVTNACRDNRYSPHAGFVVDPFSNPGLDSADKYAAYEKLYNGTSNGGSTDIIFRNCTARYFVVDYCIAPHGHPQNAEAIKIVDSWGDYAKVAISTGQSQSRSVYVDNFKSWGACKYIFDCDSYGAATGCPPEVNGLNVAGGNRYLCNLAQWISKGLIIRNAHIESLWSLGGCSATVNELSISDSWINLAGYIHNAKITPPKIIFNGGGLVIKNSVLWQYGSDSITQINIMAANSYYENTTFDFIPKNNYVTSINSFRNCMAEGLYFGDDMQVGGAGPTQLHDKKYLWIGRMSCYYPNHNPLVRTRIEGPGKYFIPQLILGDVTSGSKMIRNVVVEGGTDFVTGVPVYTPYFPAGTKIISYKEGVITMSATATISISNAAILSGNWIGQETGIPDAKNPYLIGYKVGDKIINNRTDLFPDIIEWTCTKNGITGTNRLPEFKSF